MIKIYEMFLNKIILNGLYEANTKNKISRSDLSVGTDVMTMGEFDEVNLDYQVGTIIEMIEYGKLLIQFERPFSKKLHAGFEDIGKKGHCFYVPLNNIVNNNRAEFEKIIKNAKDEEKNIEDRLNINYKEGDIVVGVGQVDIINYRTITERGKKIDIDGEVGIVYYKYMNSYQSPNSKNKKANNCTYWIGFLDNFSKFLYHDENYIPKNNAGLQVDKIHLRHATPEEIEKFDDKLSNFKKEIKSLKEIFQPGDVVVTEKNILSGIKFDNNVGVVYYSNDRNRNYIVRFLEKFNDNLYDVNYIIGDNSGYVIPKNFLRKANDEEIQKNIKKIEIVKDELDDIMYNYTIGEEIITHGEYRYGGDININGQMGKVIQINGDPPIGNLTISYYNNFHNILRPNGKYEYCLNVPRCYVTPFRTDELKELKRKLENKEILPFMATERLNNLIFRLNLKIKYPFLSASYFDISDTNDMVTYLPVDKFKRLEDKEDPYKSRFRQPTKMGKFFRMLNKDLIEAEIEKLINSYKADYDMCVKGVSDKLTLVSGEAIRFWYNGRNYEKGGGSLNSSCIQDDHKGKEMQMFVDNPETIQMLIIVNENKKLIGRALVWRLIRPANSTYMDYVYTRYDKDQKLFEIYANNQGWMTWKNKKNNIVCKLRDDIDYFMGKNALDHFDTFRKIDNKNHTISSSY